MSQKVALRKANEPLPERLQTLPTTRRVQPPQRGSDRRRNSGVSYTHKCWAVLQCGAQGEHVCCACGKRRRLHPVQPRTGWRASP